VNYWLLKTEPSTFSVDTLASLPKKTSCWDGVRNYQARNMLRNEMRTGDRAFLYHSSCDEPGVVGIVKIVREGYPDHTAFDRNHKHYDPDSKRDDPRWFMVDVQLERKFKRVIALDELRAHAKSDLKDLWILRAGNRLSIVPISAEQWEFIVSLE
jgi:predicted RNA-binding protein with PUA-like domain